MYLDRAVLLSWTYQLRRRSFYNHPHRIKYDLLDISIGILQLAVWVKPTEHHYHTNIGNRLVHQRTYNQGKRQYKRLVS